MLRNDYDSESMTHHFKILWTTCWFRLWSWIPSRVNRRMKTIFNNSDLIVDIRCWHSVTIVAMPCVKIVDNITILTSNVIMWFFPIFDFFHFPFDFGELISRALIGQIWTVGFRTTRWRWKRSWCSICTSIDFFSLHAMATKMIFRIWVYWLLRYCYYVIVIT